MPSLSQLFPQHGHFRKWDRLSPSYLRDCGRPTVAPSSRNFRPKRHSRYSAAAPWPIRHLADPRQSNPWPLRAIHKCSFRPQPGNLPCDMWNCPAIFRHPHSPELKVIESHTATNWGYWMSKASASHSGRSGNPKVRGLNLDIAFSKSGWVNPMTLKLILVAHSLALSIIRIGLGPVFQWGSTIKSQCHKSVPIPHQGLSHNCEAQLHTSMDH